MPPSGGQGASGRERRGLAQAAPGGGGSDGRRERPALTLSQQAPSSTNSRQNSYSRESAPLPAAQSARARVRETRAGREGGAVRTAHSAPGLLPSDTTARAWEPRRSRERLAAAGMQRAARVSRELRALRGNRGIPSAARASRPRRREEGGADGVEPFGARRERRGGAAARARGDRPTAATACPPIPAGSARGAARLVLPAGPARAWPGDTRGGAGAEGAIGAELGTGTRRKELFVRR